MPESQLSRVRYLENRNHLCEHFARFGRMFASISRASGWMFANILQAFPPAQPLQKTQVRAGNKKLKAES
jgi:hypothetical protein